jgi:hypothetical protein
MTIEKGKPWGSEILVPSELLVVANDQTLAQLDPATLSALTGGDMWRALGEPAPKSAGQTATAVPVDAFEATITTGQIQAVVIVSSSVQIGSWIQRSLAKKSRYVAVTNSGILERRNIAPRAHPNDGFADVMIIEATMPLIQRVIARRRASIGNHLPHPNISVSRSTIFEATRENRSEVLRLDGRLFGEWDNISVRVLPDYWTVII